MKQLILIVLTAALVLAFVFVPLLHIRDKNIEAAARQQAYSDCMFDGIKPATACEALLERKERKPPPTVLAVRG
jgi:hypothetical protein